MKDGEAPWTPAELRAFLGITSLSTWYRVKKSFPRLPLPHLERYDPSVVREIVRNRETPAQQHRIVKATRRRLSAHEAVPVPVPVPATNEPHAVEHLWTPQDLRAYLRIEADSTWYRVKKSFPRLPVPHLERYDPRVIKAIVAGEMAPARRVRPQLATLPKTRHVG